MLSDAISAALPDLRAEAEANMTSTCTIRAKGTGEPVTDPDTLAVTVPPGDLHYSGRCKVRPGSGQSTATADAGAEVLFTFDYVVSVPFAATEIAEGDDLTFDASPDPALVGRTVEVQHVHRGERLTARRLFCKEVA